jgi:hypothetical protein
MCYVSKRSKAKSSISEKFVRHIIFVAQKTQGKKLIRFKVRGEAASQRERETASTSYIEEQTTGM